MDIENPQVWPTELKSLIRLCTNQKKELLIMADTNCHSTLWGCTDSNGRGEMFETLLAPTNLSILNVGSNPTFFNHRCETIIDATLASPEMANRVQDWHVDTSFTGSDHYLINFNITISVMMKIKIRNWKGDYSSFQSLMEAKVYNSPGNWTEKELDNQAEWFEAVSYTHLTLPTIA